MPRRWRRALAASLAALAAAAMAQPTPRTNGTDSRSTPTKSVVPGRGDTSSAVVTIGHLPAADRTTILLHIKSATDGIQFAVAGAASSDLSKTLRGVGDAVAVLPGMLGYAGIAFSLAAAVAAAAISPGRLNDPVLSALDSFKLEFRDEVINIQRDLEELNDRVGSVIVGIDRILDDLSEMPAKVVAETRLAQTAVMKDSFSRVQVAATDYASGKLSSTQMVGKCDDFDVAARFSELETIVKDDKDLFSTTFGVQDALNGRAQIELLAFYMSVIPLVSNCNALKYPLDSLLQDGKRMELVIQAAWKKASWYLATADQMVFVQETLLPFRTIFGVNQLRDANGFSLALSFKAYSVAPPHGACFTISSGYTKLLPLDIPPTVAVPDTDSFCVKAVATDDAPIRLSYAERGGDVALSIIQPEMNSSFDALPPRGWIRNELPLFTSEAGNWTRRPVLTLVEDFVIMQAETDKVSLDKLTIDCQNLGQGYDRDGDGHSKDYEGAPWTIFCLNYAKMSIRDSLDSHKRFLMDVKLIEMDVRRAENETCSNLEGYVRDARTVSIPSSVKSSLLGGKITVEAFAACLKWGPLSDIEQLQPADYMARIWMNDSLPMREKPQMRRNAALDAPTRVFR